MRKYSDHIAVPVLMEKETVNQASALWTRPKGEITDEQYTEFYKHVAHDFQAPLAWTHNRVEGRQEYTQLLYLPAQAPFDLWDRHHRHGLKLYVRRVFIMDDAEQLLPAYLRFVRGVVDSADLPLNVSREILQQSKDVDAIRAGCAKRVLGLLEDLAEKDKDKYAGFWREFGRVLKEGAERGSGQQGADREAAAFFIVSAKTAKIKRFPWPSTSRRMKEGQEKIYYVTAETFLAAKNSPHLEIFRKRGIEVLLLSERVDEWLVGNLTEFEGKKLASVARGDLDLGKIQGEEEKKAQEARGGRAQGAAGKAEGSPRRQGEGGARVDAPHRVAVLPGGGRARHGRQPRAHPQGGGPEGAAGGADPRDQPGPCHRPAAESRTIRRWRTGRACCSTRPARRRGAARRPGGVRPAQQRAAARHRREVGAATMAGMSEPLVMEVFSDYVCPWCYLGAARVERLKREHNVKVKWVHFPLHPDTPQKGRSLEDLFAGRGYDIPKMQAQMRARMEAEGLPYGNRSMTYNSRLAQELGTWADTQPGGEAIHDALFRAYFVDGRDIGDPEVLVEIAQAVGLPAEEARAVIETRSHKAAVDADWEKSHAYGVTGVPTYVAGGHGVVGAQPYEALEALVKQARSAPRG